MDKECSYAQCCRPADWDLRITLQDVHDVRKTSECSVHALVSVLLAERYNCLVQADARPTARAAYLSPAPRVVCDTCRGRLSEPQKR